MSSSPPPTHSTGVGAAADSPAPQSPAIPGAESSPSTPDVRADEGSGEGGADLPMTMQASVILTSLPKDAKSALEGAGEVGVEKGEWVAVFVSVLVFLESGAFLRHERCLHVVLFSSRAALRLWRWSIPAVYRRHYPSFPRLFFFC